jgi:two-component system chemotaxis sensor kinase CheA
MAGDQGKRVRLLVEARGVEVDTRVVEQLRGPLNHMIRNAIDHGIERPHVRQAAGKDPVGTIRVRAGHESGNVVVQMSDDGIGLDRERIVARAMESGIVSSGDALRDPDIFRLIFEPGFSTSETVSEVSGRGVGLDVVRRNIEALRGSVDVASRPGEGTTFTIRLPLTLAIIEGLGVEAGGETYVIPLDAVVECGELPEESRAHAHGLFRLRDEVLPYIRLARHFGSHSEGAGRENVVVVERGRTRVGVVVDRLLGACQTVVKPLGNLFRSLPGVFASAVMSDGKVALILDVSGLVPDPAVRPDGAS